MRTNATGCSGLLCVTSFKCHKDPRLHYHVLQDQRSTFMNEERRSSEALWKGVAYKGQTYDRRSLHQPHSQFTKPTVVLECPFQPLDPCSPPSGREPPRKLWMGPAQRLRSGAGHRLIPWPSERTHPRFLAVSTGYTHSEKERKT